MLRKITILLTLVCTFAFTTTAMAQDGAEFDPAQMEGVESGYGRMYMADFETMFSTPESGEAMAEDTPLLGMVGIFTFEDEDAAQENVEFFGDRFVESVEAEGADLEKEELDLGNEAYTYTGDFEIDDETSVNSVLIVVQENEYIYFVMAIGGEDVGEMGQDWAEFMLDADISDEEVHFSEDGTSTGGVYEAMPTAGDADLLGDFFPAQDIDLLEVGVF